MPGFTGLPIRARRIRKGTGSKSSDVFSTQACSAVSRLYAISKMANGRPGGPGLGPPGRPFAILEIAYNRETAEHAWVENTSEDLEPVPFLMRLARIGRPVKPGIYGDIDEVDFSTQAV